MRWLMLVAWLIPMPVFAADDIEKKLDLILEKLEKIEETYADILQTSEAFKGLFTGELLLDSKETKPNEPSGAIDLQSILDDALKNDENNPQAEESAPKFVTGDDYFEVVSWSAIEKKYTYDTFIQIKIEFKNKSTEGISIVDGAITMSDKLGEEIVRLSMENDINLAPNQVFAQEG